LTANNNERIFGSSKENAQKEIQKMAKTKQQALSLSAVSLLKEISKSRKEAGHQIKSMQDVAGQAIEQLHKKEFK
jgi:hypothetical protein